MFFSPLLSSSEYAVCVRRGPYGCIEEVCVPRCGEMVVQEPHRRRRERWMGVDVCAGQAAALTMGMTMGKRGCGARRRAGCARRARGRFGQRALVGSGHVEQGARSVGGGREVEGGVWRWRGIKKRHVHQLLSRRKRARAGEIRKRPHGACERMARATLLWVKVGRREEE